MTTLSYLREVGLIELVYVRWLDAWSRQGWFNQDEIENLAREGVLFNNSVGYKVCESAEVVILAQSVNARRAADLLCIPKVCIVAIYSMPRPNLNPEPVPGSADSENSVE